MYEAANFELRSASLIRGAFIYTDTLSLDDRGGVVVFRVSSFFFLIIFPTSSGLMSGGPSRCRNRICSNSWSRSMKGRRKKDGD